MVISRLIGCSPSTESIDVNNSTYSNILEETPIQKNFSPHRVLYWRYSHSILACNFFCFLQCPNYSFNSFFPLGYNGQQSLVRPWTKILQIFSDFSAQLTATIPMRLYHLELLLSIQKDFLAQECVIWLAQSEHFCRYQRLLLVSLSIAKQLSSQSISAVLAFARQCLGVR